MNDIQIFKNSEFGELRILTIDGKEYFPATACAKALGYEKPHDAISRHCRDSVKHGVTDKLGRTQQMNFIPEGDLYRLIVSSKLPSAEKFERWVFDDVLPTIRKIGSYSTRTFDDMAFIQEVISRTVTTTITVLLDKLNIVSPIKQNDTYSVPAPADMYAYSRCKLETFPTELKSQVDGMITDMQQQQSLNFSMIARFCTMNGYPISSPAVKRYFDKQF